MPLTIVQLSPKPQMSERRSKTICAVVERPDHHFGDDLVLSLVRSLEALVIFVIFVSGNSELFQW